MGPGTGGKPAWRTNILLQRLFPYGIKCMNGYLPVRIHSTRGSDPSGLVLSLTIVFHPFSWSCHLAQNTRLFRRHIKNPPQSNDVYFKLIEKVR
jgi:hypothetical protein